MSARARKSILVAAVLMVLAPARALGAWEVDGHGYGHGVGMSQYGAYGYAKHGASYKAILEHYYTDTKVSGRGATGGGGGGTGGVGGKAGAGTVRVLLGSGGLSVGFRGASRACGKKLDPTGHYEFVVSGGGIALHGPQGKLAGCGAEGVASAGIDISGFGRYRGSLVAHAHGGEVLVITSVDIDGYVRGVVPNEMPSSWPQQALRAQAVAARSYGLSTRRSGAFDLYSDTRSQVYAGRSSENPASNRAVKATAGQVVTYRGKIATTYYFSTSGGQTEDSRFGFGGSAVAYLKSVKDPYDDVSPLHDWTERFSDDAMESKLSGLFQGSLQRIDVVRTGVSPRIVRARVVGSGGSSTVSGSTLQSRLGLRSTWARFKHR